MTFGRLPVKSNLRRLGAVVTKGRTFETLIWLTSVSKVNDCKRVSAVLETSDTVL